MSQCWNILKACLAVWLMGQQVKMLPQLQEWDVGTGAASTGQRVKHAQSRGQQIDQ